MLIKNTTSYTKNLWSLIDRQAAGRKKVFFGDTGLANWLGKASLGQLFENSVFQSLRPDSELFCYSKDSRNEIDFIVNQEIALEAKLTASKRDFASLKKAAEKLGLQEFYLTTLNFSAEGEVILAIDL